IVISDQFLLAPDEANYWQWSRYLALSYHDHPPMIAWLIWLSTTIFGHQEWAVRLPTVLGLSVTSIFLSMLAVHWFSWRVALHTTLVLQALLLTNGAALIATPDGLLIPCWAAACYFAARAIDENRACFWLLTGCCFGIGLLTKYTMVLFPLSLLLALLVSEKRKLLLEKWPWLGFGLGCLFFAPVVIWNAQHDWVTFRHVLYQGGANEGTRITLKFLGDYLGSQALLLTPLVFILILAAWCMPALWQRIGRGKATFLVCLSLPGFVVFLLLSLHVRIYGNWPAPVYCTAVLLAAALFGPGKEKLRPGKLWQASMACAMLLTVPVLAQAVYPVLPLPLKVDRTARELGGWDQLGIDMGRIAQAMPRPEQTFLFGLRYQYASELAYYVPGQPRSVSINQWTRPNVYDFWYQDADLLGKDAVGVAQSKDQAERLGVLFSKSDPVHTINRTRFSPWFGKEVVEVLYVFKGYGFKGGLRWQAKEKGDIRASSFP
ncbi:MAG: glycosyltransferase family 39 protein, partial [Desulfobulbaceae bacterium]|nr:glycosyltransferase family 39 protein [Desulfobulbaceae bacterium]